MPNEMPCLNPSFGPLLAPLPGQATNMRSQITLSRSANLLRNSDTLRERVNANGIYRYQPAGSNNHERFPEHMSAKMFSVLTPPSHSLDHRQDYQFRNSSPFSPSPLRLSSVAPRSTRDANIPSRQNSMTSHGQERFNQTKSDADRQRGESELGLSCQFVKKNPLIHKTKNERETRRHLFLKKVREGSEDRRWAARGGDDEMMRTVWLSKEKDWLKHNASIASSMSATQDEAEMDGDFEIMISSSSSMSTDEELADLVAQEEAAELETILSMMDAGNTKDSEEQATETTYGSDDEEYNELFMAIIQRGEHRMEGQEQAQNVGDVPDAELMDMS